MEAETIQALVLGYHKSGKVSFCQILTNGQFVSTQMKRHFRVSGTSTTASIKKDYELNYGVYGIEIIKLKTKLTECDYNNIDWDTIQNRFDIVYVLYDINDSESFTKAQDIITQIKETWDWDNTSVNAKMIILICNKIDLKMSKNELINVYKSKCLTIHSRGVKVNNSVNQVIYCDICNHKTADFSKECKKCNLSICNKCEMMISS